MWFSISLIPLHYSLQLPQTVHIGTGWMNLSATVLNGNFKRKSQTQYRLHIQCFYRFWNGACVIVSHQCESNNVLFNITSRAATLGLVKYLINNVVQENYSFLPATSSITQWELLLHVLLSPRAVCECVLLIAIVQSSAKYPLPHNIQPKTIINTCASWREKISCRGIWWQLTDITETEHILFVTN